MLHVCFYFCILKYFEKRHGYHKKRGAHEGPSVMKKTGHMKVCKRKKRTRG
jgi:hypothetical protein